MKFGIGDVIVFVFVILKFASVIDWSWWTVFSPWLIIYSLLGFIYAVEHADD